MRNTLTVMEARLRDSQGFGKTSIIGRVSTSSPFAIVQVDETLTSRRIVQARFSCAEHVLQILFDDGELVDFDQSGLGPAPVPCD